MTFKQGGIPRHLPSYDHQLEAQKTQLELTSQKPKILGSSSFLNTYEMLLDPEGELLWATFKVKVGTVGRVPSRGTG